MKKNKKNLSLLFGISIGVEILILLFVLQIISIANARKSLVNTFLTSTTELIDAHVQGLAYRNSKFTQQLRMYTLCDAVQNGGNCDEIVEWIVSHAKIRGGDFKEIIYCDYETGIGYKDDGTTFDAASTEYYKKMKGESLSQYISDPVGSGVEDSAFYVCKSVSSNKRTIGFIAGTVSHKTLEKAIDAIKIGENGFAMLLTGDGKIMAFPDDSVVMKENLLKAGALGYDGFSDLAKKMVAGESGYGWVKSAGRGRDLIVFSPIKGTPWSMAMSVPENQVYDMSNDLGISMAIWGIAIAVILILTASVSVWRMLKPLRALERNINSIASGNADLTHRLKVISNDDIGSVTTGFNTFMEKLHSIMVEIKNSRSSLANSGVELHSGINENSNSISEILSNIDNVSGLISNQAASVDETAGAVNEIASNIESLEKMIETQSSGVNEASAAVEEMIGNISSVNQSVAKMANSFELLEVKVQAGNEKQREMNERVAEIETQSKMLQEANSAIASIASETNLLAMNAAIEAAHAGEAGKGFSVVADEIRKLSETSASQSKTIGEQLKKIKQSIETVVDTSTETSRTFNSVSDSIKETDELVRQIKSAMEEQQEGSKQIVDALHNMSDSTAEVKNASKEMSAGNQQILDEVRRLKDATTVMKESVGVMGSSAMRINETGSALNKISDKMEDSIDQIGAQIDSFQV